MDFLMQNCHDDIQGCAFVFEMQISVHESFRT